MSKKEFCVQCLFNVQAAFAHNEDSKEMTMLVTADTYSHKQVAKFIRNYDELSLWGFNQLYIFDSVEEAKSHYDYVKEVNEARIGDISF